MRRFLVPLVVPLLLLVTAGPALAGNVHFKNRPPVTFTDNGLTLSSTGR